ncbi:MAG: glycosyl hydrolase, partial [Bacteroidota bacterium]|nr:glycosyl hydrolase [Bacteroidota bacterium]
RADVIAPTPAADRLAVADAHAALDAASWTSGLDLRCVGPTVMSGRVVDLSVNPADPSEFVVAYATGGLWHTTDHGTSFTPLFDHETVTFLGAIAVDWDTRTIWAGTGEVNSSRSSYAGLGVYRSTDWGANWEHMGLADSHHIGRMALTADGAVYVAALGALYQDDAPGERGLYRWTEATGQWTLLLDGTQAGRPAAGAVDLVVDAANKDHLYVALWDRTRRAWDFTEGGPGSGVFESIDGGATWIRLTSEANGFPAEGGIGRIGLAYHSGAARLYVMVDNQNAKPDEGEDEEGEGEDKLEAADFRGLSAKDFAALDTAALTTFLEDNGFPDDADAASLFQRVADGDLDPEALADYLGDANAEMFDPPVIGAEVYR